MSTPPAAGPYDLIPDLARLICTAQRQASPGTGLARTVSSLTEGLSLPELATVVEAEGAVRTALATAVQQAAQELMVELADFDPDRPVSSAAYMSGLDVFEIVTIWAQHHGVDVDGSPTT